MLFTSNFMNVDIGVSVSISQGGGKQRPHSYDKSDGPGEKTCVVPTSQEAQNKPEQASTTPQVQELKLNLPQILGKKKKKKSPEMQGRRVKG